jgi:hypothetical protein
VASEYFHENTGENLACTLVDTYVDFGACSRYRMVEPQTIRIANNTTGKMSCVWVLPGEASGYDMFSEFIHYKETHKLPATETIKSFPSLPK